MRANISCRERPSRTRTPNDLLSFHVMLHESSGFTRGLHSSRRLSFVKQSVRWYFIIDRSVRVGTTFDHKYQRPQRSLNIERTRMKQTAPWLWVPLWGSAFCVLTLTRNGPTQDVERLRSKRGMHAAPFASSFPGPSAITRSYNRSC